MPDIDITGLPLASAVADGDLLIKWDSTQVSGQRTQKLTAAQFRAYIIQIIPVGPAGPPGTNGTNGQAAGFSSVSATTLPPGSQATVTLGGTGPTNYTLTFGLPQGTPGTGNGNVNPTGTITDGAFALFSGATGNLIKAGDTPAAIATSGSAADLTAGTLPAGRFPALTGDITTTAGSLVTTLATSGVTAGSYTLATITFDAKGRATSASSANTTGTGSVVLAASPSLTGTPTAPTAAAGTNTTQIATMAALQTAVAGASSGSGFPSNFSTKSANYTVVTTDKNTLFSLSGSFTLSLPSASSFGAGNGIYLSKTDGNGVWAVTPASGTVDGLSTISVYQERFALVSDGTNWRSVNRPKGWIPIGTTTVSSAVASVNFTTGFTDTELRDMQFEISNASVSASANLFFTVQKSGSYQTANYLNQTLQVANTATAPNPGPTTSQPITYYLATSGLFGDITIRRFADNISRMDSNGTNTSVANYENIVGFQTSPAAPITGVQIFAQGANITAAGITQRGFRP